MRGKLVGVAVATIRDSTGIGLTIPSQHLFHMLQGRVGKAHLHASQDDDGILTIHVDVNLIDPLGKIKSVTLRYLPANKVPENIKPADLLSALPGCRELPLKIDGRLASAELSLKKGVNAVTMRYQVAAVGSLDQVSHTNNFIETIRAPATPQPGQFAAASGADAGRPLVFGPRRQPTLRSGMPRALSSVAPVRSFRDVAPEGGILIGFEVGLGKFGPNDVVTAIRPIFLSSKGEEVLGRQHGTDRSRLVCVKAKEGYAVGGVRVKGAILVDGFSVTFMKLGKNKLDPTDRYESEWVGGPGGFREERIGGNGALITGIVGTENQKDCTGLGLSLNEFGTKQSLPRAQDSRPPAATAGSTPAATAGSTPAATAGSPPAAPRGNRNQFSPKNGQFTITMPAGQSSYQRSSSSHFQGMQLSRDMSVCGSDDVTFIAELIGGRGAGLSDLPPAKRLEMIRDLLAEQCEGLIVLEQPIKQGARKGKEFHIEGPGTFSCAQVYFVNGYVLSAIVTSEAKKDLSSQRVEDFFASFELTDAK